MPPSAGTTPRGTAAPGADAPRAGIGNLLTLLRQLGAASGALFQHAALHGQLASVEWAEEKSRLARMALVTLSGFCCLLVVMLLACALVMLLAWYTPYRLQALLALLAVFALATVVAWRRLAALAARGADSFAATRREIAADIDLLRTLP